MSLNLSSEVRVEICRSNFLSALVSHLTYISASLQNGKVMSQILVAELCMQLARDPESIRSQSVYEILPLNSFVAAGLEYRTMYREALC